ncbi:MAG: DUF3853 family protein [Muribaculaceae bacterium]|nr:DUF3853 family protein [Muribaculaceae bacterium]
MENPLVTCTVEEFLDLAVEKFAQFVAAEDDRKPVKKNLVYGLAGLRDLLGCSLSTAARIKKSGVLNAAIHQTGKLIVVDADLALELMRLQNKRKGGRMLK